MTERSQFTSLLEWYRQEARDLPWRHSRDPYTILVSEIMLQQTRVETVIPFYHSFLDRFPSLTALARAPLEDVYEAWAGLGYYRRAKNLQRAAQAIAQRGSFPNQISDLLQLPGVGEYTAAALASIAFQQPAVALDGNALRVLCRIFGLRSAAQATLTRRQLNRLTLPHIPVGSASDFTQAVMELGARLCLPRQPHCLACPMQSQCLAHRQGLTQQIPPPGLARPRQRVELLALRIWHGHQILLERREEDPFLTQQWVTPWFFAPAQHRLQQYQRSFAGHSLQYVGRIRHAVTFRDLEVDIWEWHTDQPCHLSHQKFVEWLPGQTRLPRLASKVINAAPCQTNPR
ncbi:A/G-specific adenine glycosylase [bacterium]|nr:A/G-specific adenine glycosylase [bacterium]